LPSAQIETRFILPILQKWGGGRRREAATDGGAFDVESPSVSCSATATSPNLQFGED
jgi:hypothetical protein